LFVVAATAGVTVDVVPDAAVAVVDDDVDAHVLVNDDNQTAAL